MTVLRSGLNPKITVGTVAPSGAGTIQTEYDTIDMRDSMSWSLSADQQHPTAAGFVQIDWFIIERLAVRIWTDRFVVPANGVQLQARGPCVSPFCRITIGIPQQAAATTQFNVYFFGTNQVYERIAFQYDDALSNPANSFGYQNVAIMDPDTLAAGYVSALASDPVFSDTGLVVRPIPRLETPISWNTVSTSVTGGAAEALLTMDRSDNFAAIVNASNYTVPAGKRLIIESIWFNIRQPGAAGNCIVTLRLRTGATTGGNLIHGNTLRHTNTAATLTAPGALGVETLPHGIQVPAGQQFCFTIESLGLTTLVDVTISGVLLTTA